MSTTLAVAVRMHLTLVATLAAVLRRACRDRPRDERGDVPGWVMVTVMSVGLVGAITAVARPELTQIVKSALDQVR